jgi:hypothetical protein
MFDEEILEQSRLENNESETQQQETQQVTEQQRHFKNLREKAERLQKERDEAVSYIKSMESQKQQSQEVQDEDSFEIDPEELAAGKHINKMAGKIKKLENQLRNYQQQSHESLVEARIKAKYSDFDDVVSSQNIEALKNIHPELWNTLNTSPDLYNKAISAYTLIKNLGIAPQHGYDNEKEIVQKNYNKPRSSSIVSPQLGDSPITRANAFENGLTDELKKQLYKEMTQSMRKTY